MGFWFFLVVLVFIHFGRAANIIGNSWLLSFVGVKISPKFQFIMWFSGLRGAIGKH